QSSVMIVVVLVVVHAVAGEDDRTAERALGGGDRRREILAFAERMVADGQHGIGADFRRRRHLEGLEEILLSRQRLQTELFELAGNVTGGAVQAVAADASTFEFIGSEEGQCLAVVDRWRRDRGSGRGGSRVIAA